MLTGIIPRHEEPSYMNRCVDGIECDKVVRLVNLFLSIVKEVPPNENRNIYISNIQDGALCDNS